MATRIAVPTPQFAVWARRARLRLPYPLDISGVAGVGVAVPDPEPDELRALAGILAAPRVSAFGLRSAPDGATECFLAVAAHDDAMVLTMDATTTTVSPVAETELALAVVTALPGIGSNPRATATELPESEWDALVALATASKEPDDVAEQFTAARVPRELADAMAAAASRPVGVGVLGASAWDGEGEHVGPRLAAWYEYPSGPVLTERVPPHLRTGAMIRVGPLTRESAFRALATAVGDAVNELPIRAANARRSERQSPENMRTGIDSASV